MTNAEIALALRSIAELLAIRGENPFRIRAYERAAMFLEGFPQDLEDVYHAGGTNALAELPGIGKDLAEKIGELVDTGKLQFLRDLERRVPKGLRAVMAVEGMGPKRTQFVWEEFQVRNLRDLERLVRSGRLSRVRGWGTQSVQNIARAIETHRAFGKRLPIGKARPIAEALLRHLERSQLCDTVTIAGSLRRWKETIGDIDLLATSAHPERVMEFFCGLPFVARVIARGPTKANVLLRVGIEADLRVVDPDVFGAALHYFTGSKAHNIHVRTIAVAKGLTISEYGVFRGTKAHKGKRIACRTEEDVFRTVGLPYIPPELREDIGEVELAEQHRLPALLEAADLHGDLHLHSDFSDGSGSMEEMIAAAKRAGRSYIALTDHASVMGMVRGLKTRSPQQRGNVAAYVRRVRAAAAKVSGIQVLVGAEVDILPDGRLYLSDAELRQLDWVIGSVHQSFKQTPAQATQRLLRAMDHPALRCIGHPSTRLIGGRGELALDWDAVFRRAAERDIALELNASWVRLDLDDVRCRRAQSMGVRVCVNSDAHHPQEFDVTYGVHQARRGWLTRADVLNALPWSKLQQWLRRGRA